ncbi:hypothetical protein GCM10009678_82950 [Actinomadura kijaniata]
MVELDVGARSTLCMVESYTRCRSAIYATDSLDAWAATIAFQSVSAHAAAAAGPVAGHIVRPAWQVEVGVAFAAPRAAVEAIRVRQRGGRQKEVGKTCLGFVLISPGVHGDRRRTSP